MSYKSEEHVNDSLVGPLPTGVEGAIITGDPDRVPTIAEQLGGTAAHGQRRGFVWHSVKGSEPAVVVCSTGIGAPAAAVVVEELSDAGVRGMVRVGTCGVVSDRVRPGDLVVSTGSVRDEGTTAHYVDAGFPAVPDHVIVGAMAERSTALDVAVHFGITHCKDSYYSEKPERMSDPELARRKWQSLKQAGVLVTEMEASALFVVGGLRGCRCGAVLVPIDHNTDAGTLARSLVASTDLAYHALMAALPLGPVAAT